MGAQLRVLLRYFILATNFNAQFLTKFKCDLLLEQTNICLVKTEAIITVAPSKKRDPAANVGTDTNIKRLSDQADQKQLTPCFGPNRARTAPQLRHLCSGFARPHPAIEQAQRLTLKRHRIRRMVVELATVG